MLRSAPLGKLLLDTGMLTQASLDEALAIQKTDRRRLGELLVERGLVHPQQLAQLLSHQLSCPWISLANVDIDPDVLALVPARIALEHGLIPVHLRSAKGQKTLYVATDDPSDDGRWGTETNHPNVFICGAGARRGGGVSGVPGHNAAMAALAARP